MKRLCKTFNLIILSIIGILTLGSVAQAKTCFSFSFFGAPSSRVEQHHYYDNHCYDYYDYDYHSPSYTEETRCYETPCEKRCYTKRYVRSKPKPKPYRSSYYYQQSPFRESFAHPYFFGYCG